MEPKNTRPKINWTVRYVNTPADLSHEDLQKLLHEMAELFADSISWDETVDTSGPLDEQDITLGVHGDDHPQAREWIMNAYRKYQNP